VIATAPEILAVARTIRSATRMMEGELMRRIAIADRSTRQLGEARRLEEGVACPFVDRGLCVIYTVRPLACRGHASYDSRACIDALAGHPCEVPVSTLHMNVRSLVQNAMQSALRDGGYAWGVYEFNQALNIAASDEACEAAWVAGEDVFAPALVADVSCDEMAATFDAIKAQARGA
jgi:Fe-S-cluster containining protein